MTTSDQTSSDYHQYQRGFGSVVQSTAWRARQAMFRSLMAVIRPTAATKVLDVGVTCDRGRDSNFFEKLYPHPDRITAVGLEDAAFLEQDFPGLRYVKADALALPFADKEFDVAVSFAVVEHIGSTERQAAFVRELCRVSKVCCITTPNRWFPLEFHTVLPLVHWLPAPWFHGVLTRLGKDFYANEANLHLLSDRTFRELIPAGKKVETRHHRLLGPVSNLVFCISDA